MKRKLDFVRERKKQEGTITQKIEFDQTEQIKMLEEVNTGITKLWQLLNDKQEYDFDKLAKQLELINTTINLDDQFEQLQKEVKDTKIDTKVFSEILDAVKENKPLPVEIDLEELKKAVIQVEQRIQEQSDTSQAAQDYQPVRRVVKAGNRLIFDDQPTPSRGGGGGGSSSSSGGLTNTELRASPIDVNATIDTSAVATSAKQSDGSQKTQLVDSGGEAATVTGGKLDVNASIDTTGLATTLTDTNTTAIKTAVEILDNAISGSEMQVDVVAALPAGNNNIGDVDIASSALPTGAATSAKQDTQITAEQAIQASVELVDDTVATLGTTTYTEATTKGITIGAVRRDADTTLVNTTNEVAPLQVDANGRLKVEAFSGETLPVSLTSTTVTGTVAVTQSGTWDEVGINDSGNSITVDNGGTFAVQDSTVATNTGTAATSLGVMDDWDNAASDGASVSGDVAHDAADAGEPVKIGGKAQTAPETGVADNDRVNAMFDIYGKLIVRHALREDLGNQQTTITSSTSETTIVTADATYKLDLYGLIVTNISSTYTKVTIKDATVGTTRLVLSVPAQETRGFMLPADSGHKQSAANNNWTATCGTSVASIEITAMTARSL